MKLLNLLSDTIFHLVILDEQHMVIKMYNIYDCFRDHLPTVYFQFVPEKSTTFSIFLLKILYLDCYLFSKPVRHISLYWHHEIFEFMLNSFCTCFAAHSLYFICMLITQAYLMCLTDSARRLKVKTVQTESNKFRWKISSF